MSILQDLPFLPSPSQAQQLFWTVLSFTSLTDFPGPYTFRDHTGLTLYGYMESPPAPLHPGLYLHWAFPQQDHRRNNLYFSFDLLSQPVECPGLKTQPKVILSLIRLLQQVCIQSRSVSDWKCMAHHEEENQTTAIMDCWAAPKKFHLQNCRNVYIQFPGLQSLIKRKGDVSQWYAFVPTYFECAAGIDF